MFISEYGNSKAAAVIIQPVDDHDLAGLGAEIAEIKKLTAIDFCLMAVKIADWNNDLSPWQAPAVFGDDNFGDGAAKTLAEILPMCKKRDRTYFLGGYSLAGLFSMWAAYQTDLFAGIAAASPSVWFPGFTGYMQKNTIKSHNVYLSLGDREEKTKNEITAKVGDAIRYGYELLTKQGINVILEWNKGGHFQEPELRTAKAFAWVLNNSLCGAV